MPALLAPLIIWVLTSAVARIFTALGIGLFTYSAISALLRNFLDSAMGTISSLPASMLAMLNLAGVDVAISIIGGALLTRAAINAASVSVKVARK